MSVWATVYLRRPAVPPLLAAVHPDFVSLRYRLKAAEIRLLLAKRGVSLEGDSREHVEVGSSRRSSGLNTPFLG